MDDRLYDYLISISVDESALLRKLRLETAELEFAVMQISPEQGQFMSFLVKLLGVKKALEIGTFTGYSSICIASALVEGGTLLCCDDSAEWTAIAKKYCTMIGLQERIDLNLQKASLTLQSLIDNHQEGSFDFVFIDGILREQCLVKAKDLLEEDGIVMLHDAERTSYQEGIIGYKYRFWSDFGHTVVLTDNKEVSDKLMDVLGGVANV